MTASAPVKRAAARSRQRVRAAAQRRVAATLVLGLLSAAGCRLAQAPTATETLEAALPSGTTVPGDWTDPTGTRAVANDWLGSFRDPGLDAVVAEAMAHNLDLGQAAAQVEAVQQRVKLATSRLLPQVGVNLGVGGTIDDGNDDWFLSTKGLAGVAWEPDVWGRLRSKRAAAEANYEAARLDYAFARQSLAATTAKSWYLTTESLQLLALAERSVRIYSDLFDLVKLRRRAGKVGDLDVAAASARVNGAENALRQARAQAAEASRDLEILVGRYPAAELEAGTKFAALPPPVQAGLPSSLLERRPDMVAAMRDVVAAFRLQKAAELALLPSFSLNLNAGRLSDNLLSVLQVNPWMFNAAFGVYVPIYTGGALRAQIQIASARQQLAVARYGSAALAAFREVETTLMQEELLGQRLEYLEAALRDASEAVRIAKLQYQAGAMSLLWVLQLQAERIASEAMVIQMHGARLANRIDLHLALGGGFDAQPAVPASEPAK